jgi:hypothetical protein
MTFHKEGYTSLALCILFIFVLNFIIQFYYPQRCCVEMVCLHTVVPAFCYYRTVFPEP